MKKIFSWIIAILLIFLSFGFVFGQNLRLILFTPSGLKKTLADIDFYHQSKSIVKNDILANTDLDDSEVVEISATLNKVVDNYDFQSQLEVTIDDFFNQFQNNPNNIVLYYDLTTLKTELAKNLSNQLEVSEEEIFSSLPDRWKIDLTNSNSKLSYSSFFYHNNLLFLSVYALLWLMLFFLCIKSGKRYLSLFFNTLLITSLTILGQYFLFYFFSAQKVLNIISVGFSQDIISKTLTQGESGLQLLIENLLNYLRQRFLVLLLWESIPGIVISIIGLISLRIIKIDSKKIPLND